MIEFPDLAPTPTIRSARDGSWSAAATWDLGRLPKSTDVVHIEHAVAISGSRAAQDVSVRHGGALNFSLTALTKLRVSTIQVMPGGALNMGDVDSPCRAEVTFKSGPLGTDDWGCGLVVEGTFRAFGRHIPARHIRVARPPVLGDAFIALKEPPVGWAVGDRVLLPDTAYFNYAHGTPNTQFRVVTETTEYGVGVGVPLAYAGDYPIEEDGSHKLLGYLVDFSASIVFRSETPAGVRAHSIYVNEADVTCRGAAFQDMGRTHGGDLNAANPIGKYAVHCHHLMGPLCPAEEPMTVGCSPSARPDGKQFSFRGNVIERSTKWPATIHHAHWGEFSDNVIWDGELDGLATESGIEYMTRIERNFIGLIRDGSGIWHRSTLCPTNDNVFVGITKIGGLHLAAGVYYEGLFTQMAVGEPPLPPNLSPVPAFPGAHDVDRLMVNWLYAAITECRGNEAYACSGGTVAIDHRKCQPYGYGLVARHVIRDTTLWNSFGPAVSHYDTRGTLVDGAVTRVVLNGVAVGGAGTDINSVYRRIDHFGGDIGLWADMNPPGKIIVEDSTIVSARPVVFTPGRTANAGDPVEADVGKRLLLRNCTLRSTTDGPTITIDNAIGATWPWSVKVEDENGVRGSNRTVAEFP